MKLKEIICCLLGVFFCSCANQLPVAEVLNGSFEKNLDYWKIVNWLSDSSTISIVNNFFKEGSSSVVLESAIDANDVRLVQEIVFEPNTDYILSGWIKTENIIIEENGYSGAIFAVETLSSPFYSWQTGLLEGTNDWMYVERSFNSGDNSSLNIMVRLGSYSSLCTGKAWFDGIKVVKNQ